MEEMLAREIVVLDSGSLISYARGGPDDGPPVLLLHGGGIDNGLLSWGGVTEPLLALGYRVIVPDHPGYGNSPMPSFPVTMPHLVAYLTEFVERLNLRGVSLVGVSMGGAMALSYALQSPDNVAGIVVVGSYGLQDKAPGHVLSYALVRVPGLLSLSSRVIGSNRWLLRWSVRQIIRDRASLTPELMAQVATAARHPSSARAFASFQRDEIQRDGLRTNLIPRLAEIRQPVLVVHGSRDLGVPLACAQSAVKVLPDARLVVIEGAGHWTQRDCPDRFADLVLEHLRNTAAGSPQQQTGRAPQP